MLRISSPSSSRYLSWINEVRLGWLVVLWQPEQEGTGAAGCWLHFGITFSLCRIFRVLPLLRFFVIFPVCRLCLCCTLTQLFLRVISWNLPTFVSQVISFRQLNVFTMCLFYRDSKLDLMLFGFSPDSLLFDWNGTATLSWFWITPGLVGLVCHHIQMVAQKLHNLYAWHCLSAD